MMTIVVMIVPMARRLGSETSTVTVFNRSWEPLNQRIDRKSLES